MKFNKTVLKLKDKTYYIYEALDVPIQLRAFYVNLTENRIYANSEAFSFLQNIQSKL